MIQIRTGSHSHKVNDLIAQVDSMVGEFETLLERFKLLLDNAPDAGNFVMVNEFFHELRDIQWHIIRYNGEFKAFTPVFHMEAIKTVDDHTWKKVKNSTTNTTKLCESYAANLVRATSKAESTLKMIESTSIQYNTLVSAIKKGL